MKEFEAWFNAFGPIIVSLGSAYVTCYLCPKWERDRKMRDERFERLRETLPKGMAWAAWWNDRELRDVERKALRPEIARTCGFGDGKEALGMVRREWERRQLVRPATLTDGLLLPVSDIDK